MLTASVAALVAVGLSGCTSTLGYAAVVNGTVISQSTVNQELADIAANAKYVQGIDQQGPPGPVAGSAPGTYNKSFVAYVLDQRVRFEIIRQKLETGKALPTPAQVAMAKTEVANADSTGIVSAFPARYQNLLTTRQAEVDAFVSAVTAALSTDDLNQYYQAHLADYATEACVRHILIADKNAGGQVDFTASLADAKKVKAMLDAGGDFAALAKQYSQDNTSATGTTGGSAAQGGVLTGTAADGCLSTQDLQSMLTPLAQSVVSLPVNQVSDPVMTQFGYHLIQVTKRTIEPLDTTVTTDIHQRKAGQALNALVAAAHVKVNPEFGSFDNKVSTSGQVLGIVPPVVPNLSGPVATTTTAPASSTSSGSSGG